MATVETVEAPRLRALHCIPPLRRGLAFTRDGEHVLFVSNISGQFNLWRVPVGGGWPDQLTSFAEQTVRADRRLAAGRHDRAHRRPRRRRVPPALPARSRRAAGPSRSPTLPRSSTSSARGAFSPDGTKLAYAANRRTPTDMEVWIRDLETGETRNVFGEGMYAVTVRLVAGRHEAARGRFPQQQRHVHPPRRPRVGRRARDHAPRTRTASTFPARGRPTVRASTSSATKAGSFAALAFYDLAAGRFEWVETPDADVEEVAISRDGRVLAWLVNEDGWEVLKLRDLESGEDLPDPAASGRRAATSDRVPSADSALRRRLARRRRSCRGRAAPGGLGRGDRDGQARVRSPRAGSACRARTSSPTSS